MKRHSSKSFVLSGVIVGLSLVALVMYVLAQGANTMRFQADRAYLRAVERDLIASGLAWARTTLADANAPEVGETVSLDVEALGCRDGELMVRISASRDGQAVVHVRTSCTKGRQTLTSARDYTVRAR